MRSMVECVYTYISCYDVLEIWYGVVCLEYVVVAWFEFKFCVLTFLPTSRAFWSIYINELSPDVFMKL